MFILDSFQTLAWSFHLYFSHFLFWGIGIVTALGRVSQVLLKERFSKTGYILTEIAEESLRIIQYCLFLFIGGNIAFDISHFWGAISKGFQEIAYPKIIWDLLGFMVVFGAYNILLFIVFSSRNVSKIMDIFTITHYPLKTFQLALVLGFKNIFLIPISVIYLLNILNII